VDHRSQPTVNLKIEADHRTHRKFFPQFYFPRLLGERKKKRNEERGRKIEQRPKSASILILKIKISI
jgi:hypothetical protein